MFRFCFAYEKRVCIALAEYSNYYSFIPKDESQANAKVQGILLHWKNRTVLSTQQARLSKRDDHGAAVPGAPVLVLHHKSNTRSCRVIFSIFLLCRSSENFRLSRSALENHERAHFSCPKDLNGQ